MDLCRHKWCLLHGESQHVICEGWTQSSPQYLLLLVKVESRVCQFLRAWNTNQPLKKELSVSLMQSGCLRFAGNSRKTLVCVSKGSLPGVNLMIVGGVGLTTVDPTEERWSGQTLGGNMTCWTLVLVFLSSPHMCNISLHQFVAVSKTETFPSLWQLKNTKYQQRINVPQHVLLLS